MNKKELKKKIQLEVSKITIDMIAPGEWLDEDTWINWKVSWTETFKKLFNDFFEFDESDESDDDYWLCIEYWKSENKIQYLLQCDTCTININEYIESEYIDNLVLTAVRNSEK